GFNKRSELFVEDRVRIPGKGVGGACSCRRALTGHQLTQKLRDKSSVKAGRFQAVPERHGPVRPGSGPGRGMICPKILMIGLGEMIEVALQPTGGSQFFRDKPLQAAMRDGGV